MIIEGPKGSFPSPVDLAIIDAMVRSFPSHTEDGVLDIPISIEDLTSSVVSLVQDQHCGTPTEYIVGSVRQMVGFLKFLNILDLQAYGSGLLVAMSYPAYNLFLVATKMIQEGQGSKDFSQTEIKGKRELLRSLEKLEHNRSRHYGKDHPPGLRFRSKVVLINRGWDYQRNEPAFLFIKVTKKRELKDDIEVWQLPGGNVRREDFRSGKVANLKGEEYESPTDEVLERAAHNQMFIDTKLKSLDYDISSLSPFVLQAGRATPSETHIIHTHRSFHPFQLLIHSKRSLRTELSSKLRWLPLSIIRRGADDQGIEIYNQALLDVVSSNPELGEDEGLTLDNHFEIPLPFLCDVSEMISVDKGELRISYGTRGIVSYNNTEIKGIHEFQFVILANLSARRKSGASTDGRMHVVFDTYDTTSSRSGMGNLEKTFRQSGLENIIITHPDLEGFRLLNLDPEKIIVDPSIAGFVSSGRQKLEDAINEYPSCRSYDKKGMKDFLNKRLDHYYDRTSRSELLIKEALTMLDLDVPDDIFPDFITTKYQQARKSLLEWIGDAN